MSKINIFCPTCGDFHEINIDRNGWYLGTLPCDASKLVKITVGPQQWHQEPKPIDGVVDQAIELPPDYGPQMPICHFVNADGESCPERSVRFKERFAVCRRHKHISTDALYTNISNVFFRRSTQRGIVSQTELLERSEDKADKMFEQWSWWYGHAIEDELERITPGHNSWWK